MLSQNLLVSELSDEELASYCEEANLAYRRGKPIISDEDYDFIYLIELQKRNPNHPLLQTVEVEEGFSTQKLKLPQQMLSTDKAYSFAKIEAWTIRLKKSADEISINTSNIQIKATAKLDGFAGFDDGKILYTRGDGRKGSDISRIFTRGLTVFNNSERGQGAGEIIVKKSYFEKYLIEDFEHPRSFQASLIKEKELDKKTQAAIDAKAAVFVPFKQLPYWSGSIDELLENFIDIIADMMIKIDFDVDGVVLETTNQQLKEYMGSSRKFNRWQIAFKENKEKAQVNVLAITPQVGRTGKITPVAELEPTQLSGATIVRATAHNYGFVKDNFLGEGSVIELTRSGQVIPKIVKVLKASDEVIMPNNCPSCATQLVWKNDFLICQNKQCAQQVILTIVHFFNSLANNDGFGLVTIEKVYEKGIRKVSDIYKLTTDDFLDMDFGEKTANNLVEELERSQNIAIEDWRFLASFGVERLGFGLCERLLKVYKIQNVFNLTQEDIQSVNGFAQLSSKHIINGLSKIKSEFDFLYSLGFNIVHSEVFNKEHLLLNKNIVFTGKMDMSRQVMTKQAKSLGINVLSSVSSKIDYLVIGENVGETKIIKAKNNGIKIIKVTEYLENIKPLIQ